MEVGLIVFFMILALVAIPIKHDYFRSFYFLVMGSVIYKIIVMLLK